MNRRQKNKKFKKKYGTTPEHIVKEYEKEFKESMNAITEALNRVERRIKRCDEEL